MLSLILLFVAAFAVVLLVCGFRSDEDGFFVCAFFTEAAAVAIFWFLYCSINTVGTGHMIEEKIAMYQEENQEIEKSIELIVEEYMGYGQDVYKELKVNDVVQLASLLQELKSDKMVQYKINAYLSNNDKIKELKEQEIELAKAKWKVYFGG